MWSFNHLCDNTFANQYAREYNIMYKGEHQSGSKYFVWRYPNYEDNSKKRDELPIF